MRATFLSAALLSVLLAACGTRGGLTMPPGPAQPPVLERWLGPPQPAKPAAKPADPATNPAGEPAAGAEVGADLNTAQEPAK